MKIGDVYNLPFADGTFECVLCSHTIEHVEDPRAFLAELQRVGVRNPPQPPEGAAPITAGEAPGQGR